MEQPHIPPLAAVQWLQIGNSNVLYKFQAYYNYLCWKLIFNGFSSFWQSRPNIRELCFQQIPRFPAVQNGKKQARLVQVVKIRQTVTSWHHITPNDFKSARHVISKQAHSRQWYVWRIHWRKTGKNIKVEDFQSIFGAVHFKLILQEKSILKWYR